MAYWLGAFLGGAEFLYGKNQMDEIENYDIFDDLMLHLLFPLEAFLIAYVVKQSYDTYHSILELTLFSILYVPFFVIYRPYDFVKEMNVVETIGISIVAICSVLFVHVFLVTFFLRFLKSKLKTNEEYELETHERF